MSKKTRNPVTAKPGPSPNLILSLAVLVVAVLVIGGVLLFAGRNNDTSAQTGPAPAGVLRPPDSHTLTEVADGKVTLVEFLDYQCPACEAYYQNLTRAIEHDYAGRITLVTRNFPLAAHPLAMTAAQAAEAAALQGKYPQMYHVLYDNYQSWALVPDGRTVSDDQQRAQERFDTYARQIGLDLNRFHQDMASAEVRQRIERDRADGRAVGVTSTPTIFVNGTRFQPTGDTFPDADRQLRATLDRGLAP